jgi:hypothetical protein
MRGRVKPPHEPGRLVLLEPCAARCMGSTTIMLRRKYNSSSGTAGVQRTRLIDGVHTSSIEYLITAPRKGSVLNLSH